ncbi:MAG: 4-(cytidine 5'-diphospho)-2-C-methyl-D-erythritol kinase [Ignavibacteriales bacterium]
MKKITITAPAKINLTLDVKGRRPDGFHDIESIMHQIDLVDEVVISEIPQGICLDGSNLQLSYDNSNLAYRAAKLLLEIYGIKKGVNIFLAKNIPLGAGLAGGSTNAASVLKGINRLFELNINERDMLTLAGKLGSDVPFCLLGGTAVASGKGEILTPVINRNKLNFLLVNPGFAVSTADIYELMDREIITDRPDIDKVVTDLAENYVPGIGTSMANVMEPVTFRMFPELKEIKNELLKGKAAGVIMSGSGPTIFALFADAEEAREDYNKMKLKYPLTFLCSSYINESLT